MLQNGIVQWRSCTNGLYRAAVSGKENTRTVCIALVKPSICNSRKFYVWSQEFSKCGFLPWSLLGITNCYWIIEKAILCPCLYMTVLSNTHTHTYLHICYKLIPFHFSLISNYNILAQPSLHMAQRKNGFLFRCRSIGGITSQTLSNSCLLKF